MNYVYVDLPVSLRTRKLVLCYVIGYAVAVIDDESSQLITCRKQVFGRIVGWG